MFRKVQPVRLPGAGSRYLVRGKRRTALGYPNALSRLDDYPAYFRVVVAARPRRLSLVNVGEWEHAISTVQPAVSARQGSAHRDPGDSAGRFQLDGARPPCDPAQRAAPP